jgi:hypothetical protein
VDSDYFLRIPHARAVGSALEEGDEPAEADSAPSAALGAQLVETKVKKAAGSVLTKPQVQKMVAARAGPQKPLSFLQLDSGAAPNAVSSTAKAIERPVLMADGPPVAAGLSTEYSSELLGDFSFGSSTSSTVGVRDPNGILASAPAAAAAPAPAGADVEVSAAWAAVNEKAGGQVDLRNFFQHAGARTLEHMVLLIADETVSGDYNWSRLG